MRLSLSRVQLLKQLHALLSYSNSKPFVIMSRSYIEFMERHYGSAPTEQNPEIH